MHRRSESNQLIAEKDVRRPGVRRNSYFDKDAKSMIVGVLYTRIRDKKVKKTRSKVRYRG